MATTSTASVSASPAPRRRRSYTMWIVLAILLIAAFVPPWINVNRYRLRVINTISRALGREVSTSEIGMRLLPRPGLVLSNFVVADDPSYSAEPMLRAETVTAIVRLTSLWRGRLEIGTLELDNPSLNLVRRADGHWNLEQLLQHTSQVSSAPTTALKPEARPRFPYIEANTGRINFKLGQVKKAFSFTDADFALWQESENEWGVRLQARPMRTDLALNDTGEMKVEGRLQRAAQLRDTPVRLKIDFSRGQLGQITKLLYGGDRGWRGGVETSATMTGTPAALSVVVDAQVEDFRRYDIALGEAIRLRTHCTGTYSAPAESLSDIVCESPIKPGVLRVSGNAQHWGSESLDIAITAEQVPMDRIIAFARHAKKDLPADLNAGGQADAALQVRKVVNGAALWSGGGRTSHLAVRSAVLGKDLEIGEIEFAVPGAAAPNSRRRARSHKARLSTSASPGFALVVKPFALPMGAASPATGSGFVDEENYRATVSGDTDIERLTQVARALGIATPGVGLAGKGEVELEVSGTWVGFAQPVPSGQIKLQDATVELQGVNEPLKVESATASLANDTVNLISFSGSFVSGPALAGKASFPVHCTSPEACVVQFNLRSDEVSMARLNQLLNPAARSQPWYQLLSLGQRAQDAWLKLHANGTISISRFQLGPLLADNLSGKIEMNAGRVQIDILRSDLLGGHHSGRWTGDFTASPPKFAGGGSLQKISMDQLSALMHDNWATGLVTGKFGLTMQGKEASAVAHSINGSLDFTWSTGSLRHVVLEGHPGLLVFSGLTGVLEARSGTLLLDNCKMDLSNTSYEVSGTTAYDRTLNIKLQRSGGTSYAISGSLDKPRVETLPAAEAALR